MENLFNDFRLFEEEEKENPSSMVNVMKKQFGIAKKIWVGMPVLVSNTKIGKRIIREPTMFYVSEFDRGSVTLKNVPMTDNSDIEDDDGDFDIDKNDIHGTIEIIISKEAFYELQKPQGMQPGGGAAGGGAAGGMGGI